MNQDNNQFNQNNFNMQGNNVVPDNQPLHNNQNFNNTFNQGMQQSANVNQQIFNQQAQLTSNYQQPINQPNIQQPTSQSMNTFDSGNTNSQNFNIKPPKKINLGLIIGVVAVVTIAIGTGIYFMLSPNSNKNGSNNEEQLNKAPSDYISIETVEDYEKLLNGTFDLSKNYILMNDIDLGDYCKNNTCYPIGVNTKEGFTGIFNGNNHTISNYYYNINDEKISNYYSDETLYGIGFFSKISMGTIRNLKMKNSTIELSNYGSYGTPIGLLSGIGNNVLIENCDIDGTIKTNDTIDDSIYSVGLLVGELNLTEGLNNQIQDRTIKTGYSDYHIISTVKDTSVSGSINLISTKGILDIGGMIGNTKNKYHDKYGYAIFNSIENCKSSVDLNISSSSSTSIVSSIGGLIGGSSSDYIYQSYSSGNVTAKEASYVAGFIGTSSTSKVEQCYSTGNVVGGSSSAAFIGYYNSATGVEKMGVTNSYSTGNITCTKSYDFSPCTLFIENVGDNISNNYAVGNITNNSTELKRFNQYNSNLVETTNYCNSDMINEEKSECTKLTSAQMFQKKSYIGFDFENIWSIEEGKNTPQLKWQDEKN